MPLKRVLGPWDAGWLVAGSMIGSGIFYNPGPVAATLPGAFWPLLAWSLGGLLAVCGAAIYGELGARFPRAGGDYQYLTEAFGPFWGFLTGWAAFTLTFSAAVAAMCIVVVDYLQAAIPALAALPPLLLRGAPPLLVLLLTVANIAGARVSGRATLLLTAVPVAGLLAMFGYGLLAGRSSVGLPTWFERPEGALPLALGSAMVPIFFTYTGWNAAAYVAGEIRDPGRNLARALLWGTALVTLLYVVINAVLLAAVPPEQLAGSTTAGAEAARRLLGPSAERLLSLAVAVAVLGTANVTLMAGSRVYFAMAADGLAPRALARINSHGSPAGALWAGGLWTAVLTAVAGVGQLVHWATLAILLLSSLAVISLFVFRARSREQPAYRCVGYPFTPAIYLAACAGVSWSSATYDPRGALWGVLIVASGLPLYLVFRRSRARRRVDDA